MRARRPMRSAAAIWLRMRASRGLTSRAAVAAHDVADRLLLAGPETRGRVSDAGAEQLQGAGGGESHPGNEGVTGWRCRGRLGSVAHARRDSVYPCNARSRGIAGFHGLRVSMVARRQRIGSGRQAARRQCLGSTGAEIRSPRAADQRFSALSCSLELIEQRVPCALGDTFAARLLHAPDRPEVSRGGRRRPSQRGKRR